MPRTGAGTADGMRQVSHSCAKLENWKCISPLSSSRHCSLRKSLSAPHRPHTLQVTQNKRRSQCRANIALCRAEMRAYLHALPRGVRIVLVAAVNPCALRRTCMWRRPLLLAGAIAFLLRRHRIKHCCHSGGAGSITGRSFTLCSRPALMAFCVFSLRRGKLGGGTRRGRSSLELPADCALPGVIALGICRCKTSGGLQLQRVLGGGRDYHPSVTSQLQLHVIHLDDAQRGSLPFTPLSRTCISYVPCGLKMHAESKVSAGNKFTSAN